MSFNLHRPKIWTIHCFLFFLLTSTGANDPNHLENILNKTNLFFEKLKVQFGSLLANNETLKSIDLQVNEFIANLHEGTKQRSRKDLFQQDDYETESEILAGFDTLPNYRIPIATDVSFFSRRSSRDHLNWYIATINPDGVYLLQFNDENFTPVNFFPLKNGKLILTYSKDFSTHLIIQRFDGIIKVLRLCLDGADNLIFSQVQTLPTNGSQHAATWTGMNHLYLAVSSSKLIRIYIWLEENFDQIQVLDVGADKLIPLQTGGSMILAATGQITRIISYQLKSDKFIVTQELKASQDATGFQSENGIFGEHLLVLAEENSAIIYKERKRRYVPFQKLEGTHAVQALFSNQKILLFFIQKNGGMKVFQYDGLMFSDLQIHVPKITQVYPTYLPDGRFVLAMKTCDHQWSFQRMIWRAKKNWQSVKDEIRDWCKASLRSVDKNPRVKIPTLKHTLVFTEAQIDRLSAIDVNGRGAEEFSNITGIYKKLSSRFEDESKLLKTFISLDDPVFTNISAKKIKVMSKVIANNTETLVSQNFMNSSRTLEDANRNMTFRNVKTLSIVDFSCPIPAINYEKIDVTGLINGKSFELFVKDTLKTNEKNQVVTGWFTFNTLKANEGNLDLDIAWNSTRQELRFINLTVDELNLSSGYFLPLNGEDVTITGDLTIARAQINGPVHLSGAIRGNNAEKLKPMTHVIEPMTLEGHYYIDNAKVSELLETEDLVGPNGGSYKTIRNNYLPLKSKGIPVQMKFQSKNVHWKNVTLTESLEKWITTKTFGLNITGRKTVGNLTISQSSFDKLPRPVVSEKACTAGILTLDIYTTNITVNSASVSSLTAERVFGASEMEAVFSDSVISWNEVPWELKNITGEVKAKNAAVSQVSNIDLQGLDESMARWSEPGVLKGPIRVKNLRVKYLQADKSFSMPIPKIIKRFKALGNLNVTRINRIHISDFINNAVEIDDMISLTNITFLGGLFVDNIMTSTSNIPFVSTLSGHFGSKTVTGSFKTEHLIIPDVLSFPPADGPMQLIVAGNVTFINEPTIENLNDVNLEKLSRDIWMKNKPAKFRGKFLHLKNMTLDGAIDITGELNTLEFGPWSKMSEKIFSKSSDQEINHKMFFKSLKAVNIIGTKTSKLISSSSTSLHDLQHKTLKKTGDQTISSAWNFEKIVIKDNIKINGLVNDLNLNNEVLRTDFKDNIITGKIIVDKLRASNVVGLNFHEFSENTLKTSKQNELVVIKGKKIFRSMRIQSLNLTSTVCGKKIESCLLKHLNQTMTGKKVMKRGLIAPGIVTDGLINDIDLTRLLVYQLKKNSPLQVIETPLVLQKSLKILGNLTIDKIFQGVDLKNFKSPETAILRLSNLSRQLLDYSHLAEGINLVLQSRAFYFDKLELIEENSTLLTEIPDNKSVKFNLLGDCHIHNFILHCNKTEIMDFSRIFNSNQVLELKAVSLDGVPRIVCITTPTGGISIYSFDEEKLGASREAEIQIPDVHESSIATYMGSIWIVLGLNDESVVLRYQDQEFQEHVLPGSESFALKFGLSDELLLFRSDGVWRLGGLAGPKLIFKANLRGEIQVFNHNGQQYVQLNDGNTTALLKAHYFRN